MKSEPKPFRYPAQDMTYGGQVQLRAAASNPITSMATSHQQFIPAGFTAYRRIDNIEIQTRATDAKGIVQESPEA